jgi:DNA-binding NarL/FixJ family response regulator
LLACSIGKCKGLKLVGVYDSGQEALRDLPTKRPDVVLMDIKLPGRSGIDCVRALFSHG